MIISEHVMQRRVEFHETDGAGIIHFSNYYKYMDTAVAEFFRSLDLPGPITRYWGGIGQDEYDWPYVRASCEFKKPARFDDLLHIRIWVTKIGTKSMSFAISFAKGNEEMARGEMLVVCCKNIGGGPRSQEIPREIRERIAVASEPALG